MSTELVKAQESALVKEVECSLMLEDATLYAVTYERQLSGMLAELSTSLKFVQAAICKQKDAMQAACKAEQKAVEKVANKKLDKLLKTLSTMKFAKCHAASTSRYNSTTNDLEVRLVVEQGEGYSTQTLKAAEYKVKLSKKAQAIVARLAELEKTQAQMQQMAMALQLELTQTAKHEREARAMIIAESRKGTEAGRSRVKVVDQYVTAKTADLHKAVAKAKAALRK